MTGASICGREPGREFQSDTPTKNKDKSSCIRDHWLPELYAQLGLPDFDGVRPGVRNVRNKQSQSNIDFFTDSVWCHAVSVFVCL